MKKHLQLLFIMQILLYYYKFILSKTTASKTTFQLGIT